MKKYIIVPIISALCIILTPLSIYSRDKETADFSQGENMSAPLKDMSNIITGDIVRVFNDDTHSVMELDFRDYIIGVVAGEMPVVFHEEALSACAVAAATLTRKKLSAADADADEILSTDPAKNQAYMSREEMKERWGDAFPEYYNKLCDAVDEAIGYSIMYDGELITAVYHAISTGVTENAENVWLGEVPYLVGVESEGDKYSPGYSSCVSLSREEFVGILKENGARCEADDENIITHKEYTSAGRLKTIKAGGKEFSGEEFRRMFSLRSAAVEIETYKDIVTMNVKGYGHGVGLSQYGADYYARQGKTWQEIIEHYYTGVEIVHITKG